MAIRDKMAANAAPYLQPGEQIQAIFGAQTMSPYWAFLTYWILIFGNKYRIVAATDRRIVVFESGKFRTTPVRGIVRELPRGIQLGPPHGLWWRCDALGEQLYVHKRFHKDVAAADALAAQFDGAPLPSGGGQWPAPQPPQPPQQPQQYQQHGWPGVIPPPPPPPPPPQGWSEPGSVSS